MTLPFLRTEEIVCLLAGELEKVMDQLQRKETECEQLVDAHHKSVCEVEEQKKKETTLEEMIAQLQSQMKQLKQEVEAKSDLVSKCIRAAAAIICSEIPEGIVSVETQLS